MDLPSPPKTSEPRPASPWIYVPRRAFLLTAGAMILAGCTTGAATSRRTAKLPDGAIAPGLDRDPPLDLPDPGPCPNQPGAALAEARVEIPTGVIRRSQWAKGQPIRSQLNPMLPPRYITVHHEGWEPFWTTDFDETKFHIDRIRVGHLNAKGGGYADIGYHFVVDRAGRVWEGRSLQWQGAHVKNHNEHNIGVMCLGNFQEQSPTAAQLTALDRHVRSLMLKYRIPATRVKTHHEWAGAKTDCPGRTLQRHVDLVRPDGFC